MVYTDALLVFILLTFILLKTFEIICIESAVQNYIEHKIKPKYGTTCCAGTLNILIQCFSKSSSQSDCTRQWNWKHEKVQIWRDRCTNLVVPVHNWFLVLIHPVAENVDRGQNQHTTHWAPLQHQQSIYVPYHLQQWQTDLRVTCSQSRTLYFSRHDVSHMIVRQLHENYELHRCITSYNIYTLLNTIDYSQ